MEGRVATVAETTFERKADSLVKLTPPAYAELRIQGLADKGVAESIRFRCFADYHDNLRGQRCLEGIQESGLVPGEDGFHQA